jgi:Ser/Thr protein kinase RdoA (MazF antagonist)
MDPANLTVTHGDCHWWNFLYPNDVNEQSVRIFDWHLWHVDLGARDLAFLLALGGFAEPRPQLEDELLKCYQSTLVSNGITDYSFEQLFSDYRWSAVRNLNIPVIFWTQGKHESTWRTALTRATASYERLNCAELFA